VERLVFKLFVSWLIGLAVYGAVHGVRAAPAEGASRNIQVLAIMSDDAIEQANALTVALRRAVQLDQSLSLMPGEYALEVLLVALDCPEPPDTACFSRIAKRIGSEQFVWGRLDRSGKDVVADLHLWSEDENRSHVRMRYSSQLTDPDDEALLDIAVRAREQLTGLARGKLTLAAGDVSGDILVDGKRAGEIRHGRAELSLPAGEHEIRLRAAGYTDAVARVVVPSGGAAQLELAPVALTAESETSAHVSPEWSGARPRKAAPPILGYAILGTGVALVGAGVYSLLRVDAINSDDGFQAYRRGFDSSVDACDEAEAGRVVEGAPPPGDIHDQCTTGRRFEILQYVFFGLSAVGIGAGTYLILSHDSKPRGGAQVRPALALGRNAGRVTLGVAF
jgi:hypothetical protein